MTFQQLENLLRNDRSIRRFDASRHVSEDDLKRLVSLIRFCASARNAQPLKYRLVTSEPELNLLFPLLGWAGYYKDWPGPDPDQRPAAYLVQCLDSEIAPSCLCDDGLQLQALTLGAQTLGLGCCIIKSFNAAKASQLLSIPPTLTPLYVLAIGYPAETAQIVPMKNGDFKYFREDNVQCVPKRPLDQLIIK